MPLPILRPLFAILGCCFGLLTGCASIEGESRKAEAFANSVLPEPFEMFDAKSAYALGDPMRVSVYLRGRRNPALQWVMTWQANKSNGGNTQESVLQSYQQAQAYLRASQSLYDILHADATLPPLQVRVWYDGNRSTYTHSPTIFLYGDLTNDNRLPIMQSLYQGINLWRRQLINDKAATALLKTPTADNFSFNVFFFAPPRPPASLDFLNIGLEPPHSLEFKSAQYSIHTSWDEINSPKRLSEHLYPYSWRPDDKQWDADALQVAQDYVLQHPELNLTNSDYTLPSNISPVDLNVKRFYVGLCTPPEKTDAKASTEGKSNQVRRCHGFQKILAFSYQISERRAFDIKVLDNTRYPFETDWPAGYVWAKPWK